MTHLILIRHGETDWNIEGRWQGQIDVPLNDNGKKQAIRLAQVVKNKKIDLIYSSDLIRAHQTAMAISHATGITIEVDNRLREIHQGEWQGLLVSEIQHRYEDEFKNRIIDPLSVAPLGGETAREVQERVLDFLKEITNKHPQKSIVIVSHGFAIAVIVSYINKIPIKKVWDLIPGNGEIIELEI